MAIWYTKWMTDLDKQVIFAYHCDGGQESKLAFSDAVRYCWPVEDRHIPEFLYYKTDRALKPNRHHAFNIVDGLLVCSPQLRDVLAAHDLGASRLHRVPIYADAEKTPSGLEPHFLLHVTEGKPDTFAPEASKNVEQFQREDEKVPRPDAAWRGRYNQDVLAVRRGSDEGADLWHDPKLRGRLFASDRLKTAIEAAGIGPKELLFHKATIVD